MTPTTPRGRATRATEAVAPPVQAVPRLRTEPAAPSAPPAAPEGGAGPASGLSAELMRLLRFLQLARAHLSGLVPGTPDAAAVSLLAWLVKCGPRRQAELAEMAVLDPSTVSRHVGQLVTHGLAQRQADQKDGRAVLLAATPAGEELFARIAEHRDALLAALVTGWEPDDVATLARLLRRLNDDIDSNRETLLGTAAPPRGAERHPPHPRTDASTDPSQETR